MCRERQQVWAAGSLDVNHQLGLSHEQRCAYGVMRCMLRQKRVLERRSRADKDEYEKGSHAERNFEHATPSKHLLECSIESPKASTVLYMYTLFGGRSGKAASLDGEERRRSVRIHVSTHIDTAAVELWRPLKTPRVLVPGALDKKVKSLH